MVAALVLGACAKPTPAPTEVPTEAPTEAPVATEAPTEAPTEPPVVDPWADVVPAKEIVWWHQGDHWRQLPLLWRRGARRGWSPAQSDRRPGPRR